MKKKLTNSKLQTPKTHHLKTAKTQSTQRNAFITYNLLNLNSNFLVLNSFFHAKTLRFWKKNSQTPKLIT